MENKQKKNKGSLKGIQFQLGLVTVCLLNALRNRKNWKISTENPKAGKYDDVVIELSEESAVLIQCKHKDSKKITKDQLLSPNLKNSEFSLPKYFFSYEEIKNTFKGKTVIICTNTDVNRKSLENFITFQAVHSDSMLHYEDCSCSIVTFHENILPDLKTKIEIFYNKNLQNSGIDKAIITDENIRDFLKNLQFFTNYPSGPKLDHVIEQLISRLKNSSLFCRTSSQEIYKKIENWFKQSRDEYLTRVRAKAMFCEIKSDRYFVSLKEYDVSFKFNNFSFPDSKRIYQVTSTVGYLLQMLKVNHALKDDKSKKLYVNPNESPEVQIQMIETFELPHYKFLIMIWTKTAEQIYYKLKQILEKDQRKKVIFVSESSNKICQLFGLEEVLQFEGYVTFEDFSKNSQEKLLKRDNFIFQGKIISLERLLGTQACKDIPKYLDSLTLEKLIRKEIVVVGGPPPDLDKGTSCCYINRTFVRKIKQVQKKINRREMKEYVFSEENIYEVNEKLIIISDGAGTGKSTVVTKLAMSIKENHPHLYVIKIGLNSYGRILINSLRNKKTIDIIELLNSEEKTNMNLFEKFIFSLNEKVVLLLDGVDEISPEYTNLVLDLLIQCQKAHNIVRIFVTTRPNIAHEMETTLKVGSFRITPFTRQNQIDFLTRYWIYSLKLNDINMSKCEQYAKSLLAKMSSWVDRNKKFSFTAIPLQIKMLAEIFEENIKSCWIIEGDRWEGCKDYLKRDEDEPKLPEKFNISALYDIFIEKKCDIFVERGSGNITANQALTEKFNECLAYHHALAVKEIMPKMENILFPRCHPGSKELESYILKMGIVQQSDGELHFLHRTFAEYFFAQITLKELKSGNSDVEFQKIIIDEIFLNSKFKTIRAFLDTFLDKVIYSLCFSTFENYRSLCKNTLNYWKSHSNIIFVLAKEGCVNILHLILKSMNFEIIRGVEINIIDFFSEKIKTNTLNDLQNLMKKSGINIKDEDGNTPLHVAVIEGELEMVKFLISQGADINSEGSEGRTAMHLAARKGNLKIVKFLVECKAKINGRDSDNGTVLHSAVRSDNLDTVKFLINLGIDIDTKDNFGFTALHLAERSGNWDAVKYLVEHGADFNIKDPHGCKILHLSVKSGNWDIVTYLVGRGANISSMDHRGYTTLQLAAEYGNLNIVKHLIEHGADIHARHSRGFTVLHLAAESGNLNTVKYLIKCGADINSTDNKGRTILHSAASSGNLDTVDYLVQQGLDFNSRDNDGRTVLHLAAMSRNLNVVKYLVDSGADIDVTDSANRTVLHSAIHCLDNLNIIRYLVKNGVDIDSKDSNGRTVLHLAAGFGKLDIIEYLVGQGVNIDSTDSVGRTALHLAAEEGYLGTIKYFVKLGIDINVEDNNADKALSLAPVWCKDAIIEYLQEIGINIKTKCNIG